MGYDGEACGIRHYRVDKMQLAHVAEEERQGREVFEDFDLAAFSRKTFGMFGGEEKKVVLRCRNSLAGVIIDRFGQDVMMIPEKQETFRTMVSVAVSPQFYGWLAGIGKGIRILEPAEVKEDYRKYLEEILAAMA